MYVKTVQNVKYSFLILFSERMHFIISSLCVWKTVITAVPGNTPTLTSRIGVNSRMNHSSSNKEVELELKLNI